MRAGSFWVAVGAGLLLAVGSVATVPSVVSVVGAVLFALGIVVFFADAVGRSRREGVSLTTALRGGARDALRFAWYLMP